MKAYAIEENSMIGANIMTSTGTKTFVLSDVNREVKGATFLLFQVKHPFVPSKYKPYQEVITSGIQRGEQSLFSRFHADVQVVDCAAARTVHGAPESAHGLLNSESGEQRVVAFGTVELKGSDGH